MRITCPFCGDRDVQEFQFRSLAAEPGMSAFERVYERRNRVNDSTEYWQHVEGCRAWLVIQRDPATGLVRDVRVLGAAQ